MNNKKSHIFLLIQSGYSARNFVLSGFLNQSEFDITFWSDQDYIKQYQIANDFIQLPEVDYSPKANFIQKVKNRAELGFNVKRTKNRNYLSYLTDIKTNRSFKAIFKRLLIKTISVCYANKNGILKLDTVFYKAVRNTDYYLACKKQLETSKPEMVFCTHQRASNAVAPVLAAKDLGIKTVCFIHSWDNIPKGALLVKADSYFVWSDYMKEEMLSHYPFISSNAITVTGTPQFLSYFDEELKLSREDFFKQLQLSPKNKYILFSGNDKTTSPNDPVYLKDLCKAVAIINAQAQEHYHILFRPNPIDRNEGFDLVLKEFDNLVTEVKPEWFGADVFLWYQGGPSKKDLALLVNTISHVELVVNMGSTMAIDAAILGKPSCYINYNVPSNYNWSVEVTYKFIHFKIIEDITPVFWVKERNQFTQVLKKGLEDPNITLNDRNKWIERVTKLPMQDTNQRMWDQLIKINNEV